MLNHLPTCSNDLAGPDCETRADRPGDQRGTPATRLTAAAGPCLRAAEARPLRREQPRHLRQPVTTRKSPFLYCNTLQHQRNTRHSTANRRRGPMRDGTAQRFPPPQPTRRSAPPPCAAAWLGRQPPRAGPAAAVRAYGGRGWPGRRPSRALLPRLRPRGARPRRLPPAYTGSPTPNLQGSAPF